jgi:hypothetical protein
MVKFRLFCMFRMFRILKKQEHKTMIKPINKLQIWDRPESAQNVIHNS